MDSSIIPHLTDGELRALLNEIKAEICMLADVYEAADDQLRRRMGSLLEAEVLGQTKELLTFRREDPLLRELRKLNTDRDTDTESARGGLAVANGIAKDIRAFTTQLHELERRMRELVVQAKERGVVTLEEVAHEQDPLVRDAIYQAAADPLILREFLTVRKEGMLDRYRRLLEAQVEACLLLSMGHSTDQVAATVRAHGLDEGSC